MVIKLESLDPKFRELTDLLLFSNNSNIDLNKFISLFVENYNSNIEYFFNRFIKSCDIYWENNHDLWIYRLNLIFSIKDKNLSNKILVYLEKRMESLIHRKPCISPEYDIEFLQYLALCKVKKNRNESLGFARKLLEHLPSCYKINNTIKVLEYFIPVVYSKIDEYAEDLSKKISNSTKNFLTLKELEKYGVSYSRNWLIDLVNSILVERVNSDKNRRLFFVLINDPEVLCGLKEKYSSLHKTKLISFLNNCDHFLIEGDHLKNLKNLISLDSSMIEKITQIYITKIYSRQFSHKRSNADRLIRLINQVPEITARMVISHLSTKNKMGDIKYMLPYFPEVKNLSAFL